MQVGYYEDLFMPITKVICICFICNLLSQASLSYCHSGWTRTTDLVPVDTRYNAPCDGMAERALPTELQNELCRDWRYPILL